MTHTVRRWVSTERTPHERGVAFGRALAPAIANTLGTYRRMFRDDVGLDDEQLAARGREVREAVESFRPRLARELEGIAVGAGHAPELLFAANARTELLKGGVVATGGAGECSTVAVVDGDGRRAVLAQNWDFHPALAASRVAWTIEREEGASFTGLTEAGILSKLGVNAHGLAVGINFLATDRDSGVGGIPVHVLLRVLLEEARTVPEAVELASGTPMTASVCITVAGPDGDGGVGVVALERWPDGVRAHAAAGAPPRLAHTNHFVEQLPAVDLIKSGPQGAFTQSRYEQLTAALEREARCDVETIARQLSSVECPAGGQPVFHRLDETPPWLVRYATLATVAFEVPAARFWLRGEDDPEAPLELVDDLGTKRPHDSYGLSLD